MRTRMKTAPHQRAEGLHSPPSMHRVGVRIDPYTNDEGRLGASLVNLAEVLLPCMDAAAVRSVAEIGAYAGDLTELLLDRANGLDGQVVGIDPEPQKELEDLAEARDDLVLIRDTSHNALRRIELPEAVIIDGDHNYYTVSEELRLVRERGPGADLPLLLLHDVCWPHGRRDDYFAPERIPEECRQQTVEWGGLFPGEPGIHAEGMPYHWPAAREGGPRNGVLTAVEDFVASDDRLRLAVVPAFFGLGIVWHADAPWADAVGQVVAPWDRNPLLERLETNRVRHLAAARFMIVRAEFESEREARKDELLRRTLGSRTFALAQQISRVRGRGRAAFSEADVRRALAGKIG
jgi:Methyltransferase domain